MNRATKLALTAALAVGSLAIAWQSNPAAAASIEPPQAAAEVPADWTTVVDETQTMQIAVPSSWTAIDRAPWHNQDGTSRPAISATTDAAGTSFAASLASWDVAGAQLQFVAFQADTAATFDSLLTLQALCTAGSVESYHDGAFAGHVQSFTGCGGTATRNVVVIANPADGAFTAVLRVQLIGEPDDEATLNGLLISFNRVGSATTKPAAASVFPSPSRVVPAGWTTLVDETRTVQISVPGTWTEFNLEPWTNEQGDQQPDI